MQYAGKTIKISDTYRQRIVGIENDKNSVSWQYFTDAAIDEGQHRKILLDLKTNLDAINAKSRPIKFLSQGDTINAVKYTYKVEKVTYHNIIGYGMVNKKHVLLIFRFNFDPNSNSKLDSTMLNFITLVIRTSANTG